MTVTRTPKLWGRRQIARIEPVVTHGFCLQPEKARLVYAGDRVRLEPNRAHRGHDVRIHHYFFSAVEPCASALGRGHGVEDALQGKGVYPAATDIGARCVGTVLADEMICRFHFARHHHRQRVGFSALGPDVLCSDERASDGLRLGEGWGIRMDLVACRHLRVDDGGLSLDAEAVGGFDGGDRDHRCRGAAGHQNG